ncbi:DsrE/DsrF/DrsH-like family protein [Methanotorris igneus]|uniref:Pyridine nucleotide-disulfide oxidoreductase family protein n=1 Tax=Methanotorris igneus (strain DSM 5666 / JCM 11834 / Kol 5) TaxID=880724 RepID=F6BEJ5_METIK|nr:DsrE/DsrF/DrsH-like family protein [Methanotorris igneus]AEF95656.1 pyridine nucleotide-disulfide oxidoreductase family protein [Methanotorris igneus Kol 5]
MTDKMALVVSEGTFDKAMMAFILGTIGATMGMEVHIFFTFFGLEILKKDAKPKLPGIYRLFGNFGVKMMEKKMKKVNIGSFEEMRQQAIDLGVNLYACSTSMSVMGIKKEDLIEGVEVVGATKFLDIAMDAKIQLFIG